MQSLSRDEFLGILGLTSGAFDQLQHAGHVALAFGTSMPATPGRYVDLDLVAMSINLALTPALGREKSTTIVAGFFHQWASAVGHAEADLNQDHFMAVGGAGWDAASKGVKRLVVTNGTLDQINQDFQNVKELVGFLTVNISDIIRRLRARAKTCGIALSGRFFLSPDDPQSGEFLMQFKRERDARLARLRRDERKFAVAKRRHRHEGISALPRAMADAIVTSKM